MAWLTSFAAGQLPTAHAHPSPAEPPVFFPDACIRVVDKRETPRFRLVYDIPVEDTQFDADLVDLPDTKTHAFFAFAGQVFPRAAEHFLVGFSDPTGTPRGLPTWLSLSDLERAREAARDHPTALEAMPLGTSTLNEDPDLRGQVFPFSTPLERVPITAVQGMRGVTWDLTPVPAGVYQLAAHVFSPPYNTWAVRAGLIKVIDGGPSPAALALDAVAGRIFFGQGRRVHGCVDAPEGSSLSLSVRPAGAGSQPFETWQQDVPIVNGEFDACLRNPGRDVSLQVRATLALPDGTRVTAYSSDAVDLFSSAAACRESITLCCPPAAELDAGLGAATEPPASTGADDAGAAGQAIADASMAAPPRPGKGEPAATVGPDGGAEPDASAEPAPGPQGGCQCQLSPMPMARSSRLLGSLLLVALFICARRRRR